VTEAQFRQEAIGRECFAVTPVHGPTPIDPVREQGVDRFEIGDRDVKP